VEKERLENEKFTRILGIITLLSGILSTLTTYAAIQHSLQHRILGWT